MPDIRLDHIQTLKAWVRRRIGVQPALVIIGSNGRNRVLLKIDRGGLTVHAEVKALRRLFRDSRRRASPEAIMALFVVAT